MPAVLRWMLESRKLIRSFEYLQSNLIDEWVRLISSKNLSSDCSPAVHIKKISSLNRV